MKNGRDPQKCCATIAQEKRPRKAQKAFGAGFQRFFAKLPDYWSVKNCLLNRTSDGDGAPSGVTLMSNISVSWFAIGVSPM